MYSNYKCLLDGLYLPLPSVEWQAEMARRHLDNENLTLPTKDQKDFSMVLVQSQQDYVAHKMVPRRTPRSSWKLSSFVVFAKSLNLRYVDTQGVSRVQGGSDLKSSQHYPRLFGAAIGDAWVKHKAVEPTLKDQCTVTLNF